MIIVTEFIMEITADLTINIQKRKIHRELLHTNEVYYILINHKHKYYHKIIIKYYFYSYLISFFLYRSNNVILMHVGFFFRVIFTFLLE